MIKPKRRSKPRPQRKRKKEMNEENLRMLAQQVVKMLRPKIADTPIKLNKNFPDKFRIYTDKKYTNGWYVLIGSINERYPNCSFQIWLNDMCGWNKMQFQYCVSFRKEDIMDQFLQQIDHKNMFGKVVCTMRDTDRNIWKTVNGIDILSPKLPEDCYGKPTLELNDEIGDGYFFYNINDLSEDVNDALVDRVVEFYSLIGRALSENQKTAPKPDDTDVYSAKENREQVVTHLKRERNRYLSLLRKQQDKYQCQICEMKFEDVYGEIGKDFAEAHHIVPLAQLDGPQSVSVDDLITVCANCHRMLHKLNGGTEDIEELKDMLSMRYEATL